MRMRRKPRCWEAWMVSTGVAASSCHTPSRSRIRRLAYDSAIGRKAGFAVLEPKMPTLNFDCCRASAIAQPRGPAPRTRTSIACAGIAHQCFDVRNALGRFGGDDFAVAGRDDDVVLDADGDVAQPLRHIVGGADVQPRLDG